MAAFFLPKSHRKFETARQLRKYSGNLRKISCGAVLLKTVEIVAANPLIQRSIIKEADNCYDCVEDEFVGTVQN